eukprot:GHVU01213844.1.p1 GENE.GHVU01213844.1~~GHVU01213844.1.p1  ORF type:complete len:285 (+),score=26.36 GHVU01213844.1:52-855(+)
MAVRVTISRLSLLTLLLFSVIVDKGLPANTNRRSAREATSDDPEAECALFTADEDYVTAHGPSYILLGSFDLEQDVDIQLEVFPDRLYHDGILLSMGSSDDFKYYEWKTKAVKTQYFVMEFIWSAVSMLLKAEGTQHMHPVEIYRTWPTAYTISDAKWHTVRAQRFRNRGVWILSFDEIKTEVPIYDKTNVLLHNKHLFLGGRPGHTSFQFKGVIKNVNINGIQVALHGKRTRGKAEVWHCSAPRVREFIENNIHNVEEPRPKYSLY